MIFRKKGHPQTSGGVQKWERCEVSDTLNVFDNTDARTPTLILEGNGSRESHKGNGYAESDTMYTLNTVERHGVAQVYDASRRHDYQPFGDVCETVQAHYGTGGCNVPMVEKEMIVRRLTPLECERLQGYPDGWTNIGEWVDSKGKTHKDADSPRYKALGNSIALPFWEWMARRMVSHLDTDKPTMASLFDGIGGFPLVYSRCGCTPVWASEIEEFPIAVTKIRFPEEEKQDGS